MCVCYEPFVLKKNLNKKVFVFQVYDFRKFKNDDVKSYIRCLETYSKYKNPGRRFSLKILHEIKIYSG